MNLEFRRRLLATTLLVGASMVAAPAFAQNAPSPTTPNQPVCPPGVQEGTNGCVEAPAGSEPGASVVTDSTPGAPQPGSPATGAEREVVVTGSRIPRPDLTSSSPLAVVNDEEFQYSGATNVEQVINTLPQVIPGATAFSNNPGGGVATLNLRGLGSQRNLVLVNGRRYIFFDPSQRVDLNTIPSFLIDSVDVVTGGASAVYGSDALAGVTNFHLRTDLEGALVGAQYSITEEGDGARKNLYAALGTQFADGRGHVTVYGEWYKRGSIFQDARPFSVFALGDGDGELVPLGSANVPQGRFTTPGSVTVNGVSMPIGAGTFFGNPLGGIFATPGSARAFVNPDDTYNYAPSNYLMVPQTRWTLGGYGEYEVNENVVPYAEVAFINNQVDNELAATPGTQGVNVPLTGPNGFCTRGLIDAATCTTLTQISANQLAANAAAALAGVALPFGTISAGSGTVGPLQPGFVRLTANYRFTQISDRVSLDDRNAFRLLGGVHGALIPSHNINYDIYYSYARTKNANVQIGNVSRSAWARNVENGTCNIFGANQLNQACIDAVSILAQNQEESILQVAQGSVSGDLFTTPWSSQAVGFAVGAEWRKAAARFIPDTALSSGDVVGFNAGDATQGSYDVKELFAELRLPLVEHSFIDRLEISAAGRLSDYSLDAVGTAETYALGINLAPVPDVMARAQYQRAIRAPNVGELFGGASVGFPAATDPCSDRTPVAGRTQALRDLCIATGVPAANVFTAGLQPNAQIEGTFGGNPNLEEEIGDTYTAGVVLSPRFLPRFHASVDWYDIRVQNAVAVLGGSVSNVLDLCYNVLADPNHPVCQAIHRDPNGVISGGDFIVEAANANLAELRTKGVDFQFDYSQPMQFGLLSPASRLNFFFLGNYQYENSFVALVGTPPIECAGKFGLTCGQPTPKWKWSSRLAWLDGPLTTTLRWRHLASVRDDDDSSDFVVERIPAYDLFDLAFAFNVTDSTTFTLGINNLFNKKPPIIGDQQEQANTFPSTYDVLGRDFFISANFRF